MDELRESMAVVANDALEELKNMNTGSQEYKETVESVTKLVKAMSDLDEKESSEQLRNEKAKEETIHRWIETGANVVATIGKIVIPVGIAVLSMGLETKGVMSFTAGKSAIRDCWDALKK